jgi:hypothetical protein
MRYRVAPLGLAASLFAVSTIGVVCAQGPANSRPPDQRVVVGIAEAPGGTLLSKEKGQKSWRVVAPGEKLFSGQVVLALPGERATILVGKSVRVTLIGGLPESAGPPALESAVVLNRDPGFGHVLTLERGRMLIAGDAAKAPVPVSLRFRDKTWHLVLQDPATEVAVDRVDHWPAGMRFEKGPGFTDRPVTGVHLFLVKGKATLDDGAEQRSLTRPSYFHWNTANGVGGPFPLKIAPAWIAPTPETQSAKAVGFIKAAQSLRRRLQDEQVTTVLRAALDSKDSPVRVLGVYDAAAVDDLALALGALGNAQHAEVRDAGVAALRHSVVRSPMQDRNVYHLLKNEGYRPGQAETLLQLLGTFSAQDLARPETFETLIDYLDHDKTAIRTLAVWHLTRIVPQGQEIEFNPAGSAEERARGRAAWRRLIPAGQLPPATQKK